MDLKHRLDPRVVFTVLYFVFCVTYLAIGLQSADATYYNISGQMIIPSINLKTDITNVNLNNGKLDTPENIVGSYSQNDNKTFLFGHSSTVFIDLDSVSLNDTIIYNNHHYKVASKTIKLKTDISMSSILAESPRDTLVLMTCAGEDLGGGDSTHRLLVTAILE